MGRRTFCASSSMSFSLSYSRRRLALYTWNSPLPAPALEPCTFFIISRGGRIVFSFGGAGTYAGLLGSLSSRSSCARCLSTALSACLLALVPVVWAGGGDADMAGAERGCKVNRRSYAPVASLFSSGRSWGFSARLWQR